MKLDPCPFCDGEAEVERFGDRRASTIYQCSMCGCSLETGEEWEHGRAWNDRVISSVIAATLTSESRELASETVMGMRVAAYRQERACPPSIDQEQWNQFFRYGKPNEYSEHWSTPKPGAERLFTESDVRALLKNLIAHGR